MMKRIYALSCSLGRFLNSPKWVLGIMVTAFIAKYALCVTFLLVAIGPGSQLGCKSCLRSLRHSHLKSIPYLAFDTEVLGTHVCGTRMTMQESTLVLSAQFPTLAFEILLFVLAFGYFVADVWAAWRSKERKMWKVNDLVQILVRDSTIYFAMYV